MAKRFDWRSFGLWAIGAVVLAVLLCPFAVWASSLFGGDFSHAPDPIGVYASLDVRAWLADLVSCLTVREQRIALLALFAVILLAPFAFENGEAFYVVDREVKGGILADQQVFKGKPEVLKRNYTWDGKDKPPVYGLVMGGYGGIEVVIPATHAVIVAPSGSGKTRGSVYQTIDNLSLNANNSLIVCDPSGEIHAMMADGIAARGYKSTFLIDLNDGKRGDRFNPLQVIIDCHRQGDGDSAEARATEIGEVLSPETGGENDYFNKAAAGLIAAVCYLVATLDEVPDDRRTMWSVAQTVYKGTDGGAEKLKAFIREQGTESPAYVMASAFMMSSDKTESNILSTVSSVLQMFNTASMKFITGGSGVSVSQVMREPTAVFLRVLPRGNSANKLASLFLAQHLAETLRQGDRGGLVPTYVVADEFSSLPAGGFNLVSGVELGRKYHLAYYMWVQSLTAFSQFSTRGTDGREAVLANADVKVLYKAGSVSDAEYFERLGGKRTVLAGNRGTSTHAQSVTDSEGYSEHEVSNWPQGDLMARDPFNDGVLVFTNISGESKHNGKFEIPVPDVTATPTARNFPTFGSREHEAEAIASIEARLGKKASRIFVPQAWTPDYADAIAEGGASADAEEDVFGI